MNLTEKHIRRFLDRDKKVKEVISVNNYDGESTNIRVKLLQQGCVKHQTILLKRCNVESFAIDRIIRIAWDRLHKIEEKWYDE
jgi:hypothetical protein